MNVLGVALHAVGGGVADAVALAVNERVAVKEHGAGGIVVLVRFQSAQGRLLDRTSKPQIGIFELYQTARERP